MVQSDHTQVRCQQRGISQEQIDYIIEHGQKCRRPGGAFEYRLLKKDKGRLISTLKKQIHMVERSVGKGVLVSNDQGTIITAYHLTQR
jgi:hypothetical protein